jgi:SPP1 family predicted phage head-tail adaptor
MPTTSSASGEQVAAYTRGATVWASLEPLSGRELLNAQQIVSDSTHQITMRHTWKIGHRDQILFGSRIFEVDFISNIDERNIELVILAHEAT